MRNRLVQNLFCIAKYIVNCRKCLVYIIGTLTLIMGRSCVSVLAAILLILALGTSRSASQPGFQFQSINCGGEAFTDPKTKIIWDADPLNQSNDDLHGKVGKVNSSLNVMKTLRFFPDDSKNRKFCYSLGKVFMGKTYLLRASFLYGNYDGLNQPPTVVLILNYDEWTNVSTSSSTIPVIRELILTSKEDYLNICLAPSNHTPFISTLELRPLESSMYNHSDGAFDRGYGLMLWQRINYGAITEMDTRYPDDPFDRIWESNTTGPTLSTSTNNVGLSYVLDRVKPPAEVMATAITSNSSKGNLSFTYDGFGGIGGFLVEMHFQEVDETARGQSPRSIDVAMAGQTFSGYIKVNRSGPLGFHLDAIADWPSPLQFTLFSGTGSPSGPLLNAIELFQWTPHPLPTSGTFQGDVDAIELIQAHFNLTGYGQGDPCMPKGYMWTWISCNEDSTPRITEIHLRNFNLIGDIPPSLNNLTNLKILDLSENMLSGQIPNLNLLLDLQILDLHRNILSGEIPISLRLLPELKKLDVSYNSLCVSSFSSPTSITYSTIGNSGLCNALESSSDSSSSSMLRKYIFATLFLGALYIVEILSVLLIYKARQSGKKEETSTSTLIIDKKGFDDPKSIPFATKMFTYNEIRNATLDFTTILGEGGFGKVYHGLLVTTGEEIAVKMLADASKQGLKEFYNEVAILSRVRHKNLVSLIGYCVENTYMLIYEYIGNGNLRDFLYGNVKSIEKPLPWTTRLHIALDASQGLEYLHMGCDHAIIHRDVKSSNILLTHKMQAKVADFGLSRLKEGDNVRSHVSTVNVAGTIGYLDPAYYATNQFTDKSDVYSFGIVLFELICGREPVDTFTSLPHIVDWVTPPIMQGKIGDIVDSILEKTYNEESMRRVVDVAFSCVNRDRMKQPKMRQVSQLLQNALEVEMKEGFSSSSQDVSGESSIKKDE